MCVLLAAANWRLTYVNEMVRNTAFQSPEVHRADCELVALHCERLERHILEPDVLRGDVVVWMPFVSW